MNSFQNKLCSTFPEEHIHNPLHNIPKDLPIEISETLPKNLVWGRLQNHWGSIQGYTGKNNATSSCHEIKAQSRHHATTTRH